MKKNILYAFSIALLLTTPYVMQSMELSETGHSEIIGAKTDFYNALAKNDFTAAAKAIEQVRKYDPAIADQFADKLEVTQKQKAPFQFASKEEKLEWLKSKATPQEIAALARFKTAIENKNWAVAERTIQMFENTRKSTSGTIPVLLDEKIEKMKSILEQARNQ